MQPIMNRRAFGKAAVTALGAAALPAWAVELQAEDWLYMHPVEDLPGQT